MLRDPPHQAGVAEQVRADLALLEVGEVNAVDAARQQSGEAGLAHVERQSAEILAIADEDVEGVELHLGVMLAAVQAVEVRPAIDAQQHGLTIDHEGRLAESSKGGMSRNVKAPVPSG